MPAGERAGRKPTRTIGVHRLTTKHSGHLYSEVRHSFVPVSAVGDKRARGGDKVGSNAVEDKELTT